MRHVLQITVGNTEILKGPFGDEQLAGKWASENIDAEIFPYKIVPLHHPNAILDDAIDFEVDFKKAHPE